MRTGFSCKELARILGVHEHSVTGSLDPALVKVAKLWRCDPRRTLAAIFAAADDLEPMLPDEMDLRCRLAAGRVDSEELTPVQP